MSIRPNIENTGLTDASGGYSDCGLDSASSDPILPAMDQEPWADYFDTARAVARRHSGGQISPDDVAQDAMARLVRRGGVPYPADAAVERKPEAYVATIVHKVMFNERKKRDNGPKVLLLDTTDWAERTRPVFVATEGTPDEALVDEVVDPDLVEALEGLPPVTRQVIELRIQGYPYRSVASKLNLSDASARQRFCRGTQAVVKALRAKHSTGTLSSHIARLL